MVNTNRNKVIIFYDEKDTRYLDRLHVHLSYYENKDLLEVWDNTNISPGEIRREERQKALASAKVAVLLISADFLASTFVDDELPVLLDAQKADGAIILSIIIGPCAFHDTELSEFQAINNPLKPLNDMSKPKQEKTWNTLAEYVKNAMLSSHTKEETASTVSKSNNQLTTTNRLFPRFLYQDHTTVDNLLLQLELETNSANKFILLYAALARQNILHQPAKFNQGIYDTIQPGQIVEIRGRARISQWEETTHTLTAIAGLSDVMKIATGKDPWEDVEARQAYQGLTSLAATNPPDNILIIRCLGAPHFQFVSKLDPRYIKCEKGDFKTELTILGMVQRKLDVGEKIDVVRLIPDMSSLENMNRANRRKTKKSMPQNSPIDEFIKYPAINIYPIAIY